MFTGISYAIFIVGAILGFVMGYTKDIVDDTYSFSFAIAIAWWGVSFIGGMFMLGFAELSNYFIASKINNCYFLRVFQSFVETPFLYYILLC